MLRKEETLSNCSCDIQEIGYHVLRSYSTFNLAGHPCRRTSPISFVKTDPVLIMTMTSIAQWDKYRLQAPSLFQVQLAQPVTERSLYSGVRKCAPLGPHQQRHKRQMDQVVHVYRVLCNLETLMNWFLLFVDTVPTAETMERRMCREHDLEYWLGKNLEGTDGCCKVLSRNSPGGSD
jgi:hypothetical protein